MALSRKLNFTRRRPYGPIKEYYPNGILKSIHSVKGDELQAHDATYYPDGKLASRAYYMRYSFGIGEKYTDNGQLASKVSYLNGLPDGEALESYENGIMKSKQYYLKGLLHGERNQAALSFLLSRSAYPGDPRVYSRSSAWAPRKI